MATCLYCKKTIKDDARFCPFCGRNRQPQAQPHHLPAGTVLNKKYRIDAVLGEGGFGITYVGEDTALNLRVAIKEFYPNGFVSRVATVSSNVSELTDPDKIAFFQKGKARFLMEARVLAQFAGAKGIVDVRDFFEENNTAYIVMEYLDGVTLKQHLREHGPLSPAETLRLLTPVMESLRLLHAENVIHRDISPDNIMLVGDAVKLLDFGAARNVGGDEKSLSVMLKPGYAPEEQYRSRGKQGPWTDVYALCATMYKCITGIRPDESPDRLYDDTLQPPSKLGIDIAPHVERALLKGLAVRAEDRWQTVDALLKAMTDKTVDADCRQPVRHETPEPPFSDSEAQQKKSAFDLRKAGVLLCVLSGIALIIIVAIVTKNNNQKENGSESETTGQSTSNAISESNYKSEDNNEAETQSRKAAQTETNNEPSSVAVSETHGAYSLPDDFSLTIENHAFRFPSSIGEWESAGWYLSQIGHENETDEEIKAGILQYLKPNAAETIVMQYNDQSIQPDGTVITNFTYSRELQIRMPENFSGNFADLLVTDIVFYFTDAGCPSVAYQGKYLSDITEADSVNLFGTPDEVNRDTAYYAEYQNCYYNKSGNALILSISNGSVVELEYRYQYR